MKKEILISILSAGVLAMSGCSGSSDDNNGDGKNGGTGDSPTTLSAQFIDSAVAGLGYDCQSSGKSGLTDTNGYFNYVSGDTCTFKVGDITLGSAQPTGSVFTPRDLTTVEPNLTNTLRLLQTLDKDENLSNGISLPSGLTGTLALDGDFDAEINTFLSNNSITNTVVTAEDAKAHFENNGGSGGNGNNNGSGGDGNGGGNSAGTLVVNTALPNMLVALHDTETMEVLEEKYSDASGRATFDVTTPRASFSVSFTPDLVLGKKFIFEVAQSIFINGASRACEGDPSVDSHCSGANWCALSTSNAIPNWTLEVLYNDNNASAAFDTNSDGQVDENEIYSLVLTKNDTNSDQVITYDEWKNNDRATVKTQLVTSTPVREYTIALVNDLVGQTDIDFCGTATNDYNHVDMNITVTDLNASLNYDIIVFGSAYDSVSTNSQDSATIQTDFLFKDDSGNYVFLLMAGVENNGSTFKTFYYETTPEALEQNKSVSFNAFTSGDLKYVTIDDPHSLGVMAYHDQLRMDVSLGDYRGIFTHPDLNYVLTGGDGNYNPFNPYDPSAGLTYLNSHWNYYGDGTLKDNYYVADYPLLDISVAQAASGGIDFSGADLSKINLSTYDLELSTDFYNFELSVTSTDASSTHVDLNLSKILPGSVKSYLANFDQDLQNDDFNRKDDFVLKELKDMNEDEIISYYMQNTGLNRSTLINGDLLPRREFKTSLINAGAVHMSPSRTQSTEQTSVKSHPYALEFEAKEFWH